MKKVTVIYARYSTDMQRSDSCDDQERNVRRDLPRFGVPTDGAVVIRDEAESGTKSSRDGFQQLLGMIAAGEVATLAVDDQSRLTRADNASAFIQDLVFAGGRFISTSEGIDTNRKGWELSVKVTELKNSATIRNLSDLVRRGQEGRVLSDGSAGDFPFGYESYYLDEDWAEQLKRRGPKPKKGLRVCEDEARWVRQVFAWFNEGKSIGWIARELTREGVSKGHRASTPGWHHQQVRRMLANEKYSGRWAWGATETVRNSQGRKKQVARPEGERVVRVRLDLRIVEPPIWEEAQRRLRELHEQFGVKEGQKPRGPKARPAEVYPRCLLGGLLVCGSCGQKLWQSRSGSRRYFFCPGHRKGLCKVAAQVPADRAEQALVDFLTDLLCGSPDWLRGVYQRARELVQEAAARVPEQNERDAQLLAQTRRQIDNLVNALADGTLSSAAVRERLAGLEEQERTVVERIAAFRGVASEKVDLPDEAWLAEALCSWAGALQGDTQQAAAVLRQAVGEVVAEPVLAPGKKRGYTRLRFSVRVWDTLWKVLGRRLPPGLSDVVIRDSGEPGMSPEFCLDLGEPTPLDRWAPQIAAWRAEGVCWEEIVRRSGLDLNRAFIAWKRFTAAQEGGQDLD